MMDLRAAQRTAPLKTYLFALVATAFIGGIAGGVAAVTLDAGSWTGTAIAAAVGAACLVGATVICLAWWRGLDEAAREAHKWAWWWGGTAGTIVAGLAIIGLVVGSSPEGGLPGRLAATTPVAAMQMTVTAVLLCQVAGYGVAWAVWWLKRR